MGELPLACAELVRKGRGVPGAEPPGCEGQGVRATLNQGVGGKVNLLRLACARPCRDALPACSAPLIAQGPSPRGDPNSPRTLGQHIRTRLTDPGLTQVSLARQLDADQWTLIYWEQDRTYPNCALPSGDL